MCHILKNIIIFEKLSKENNYVCVIFIMPKINRSTNLKSSEILKYAVCLIKKNNKTKALYS